jgi:GTP-binding protein Era
MAARSEIEKYLNQKVFLKLQVKVAKDWQQDPKLLQKLGFTQSVSD